MSDGQPFFTYIVHFLDGKNEDDHAAGHSDEPHQLLRLHDDEDKDYHAPHATRPQDQDDERRQQPLPDCYLTGACGPRQSMNHEGLLLNS